MCQGTHWTFFSAVLTASWKDKQEVVICRGQRCWPQVGPPPSGPGWGLRVRGRKVCTTQHLGSIPGLCHWLDFRHWTQPVNLGAPSVHLGQWELLGNYSIKGISGRGNIKTKRNLESCPPNTMCGPNIDPASNNLSFVCTLLDSMSYVCVYWIFDNIKKLSLICF